MDDDLVETKGYTVDNLNTKELSEAQTPFEKLFVMTRMALRENESLCTDDEQDMLQICHIVSREISKNLKKIPQLN